MATYETTRAVFSPKEGSFELTLHAKPGTYAALDSPPEDKKVTVKLLPALSDILKKLGQENAPLTKIGAEIKGRVDEVLSDKLDLFLLTRTGKDIEKAVNEGVFAVINSIIKCHNLANLPKDVSPSCHETLRRPENLALLNQAAIALGFAAAAASAEPTPNVAGALAAAARAETGAPLQHTTGSGTRREIAGDDAEEGEKLKELKP